MGAAGQAHCAPHIFHIVPIGFDVLNGVSAALRKAATSSLIVQTGSRTANNHSHYFLIQLEWWAPQAQTERLNDVT